MRKLTDTFYIQYDYRPDKTHSLFTCGYAVVSAVNKRHARKLLFKFMPKKHKFKLHKIIIESFHFQPYQHIPDLDYGNYERKISEFWSEQNHIYSPL